MLNQGFLVPKINITNVVITIDRLVMIMLSFLINKGANMEKQENKIKQFRILGSDVLSCKYEPTNKGKAYFTFKPLTGASNKKKFFDDAFNWFAVFMPSKDNDKIQFKLQTCHYNINNNRAAILGLLKNLKKLKSHHFDNWDLYKFLGGDEFYIYVMSQQNWEVMQ